MGRCARRARIRPGTTDAGRGTSSKPRAWSCFRGSDRRGDQGGFTIIEVLVAMSILSVVLLGAERAVVESMSAATVEKEHSIATGLVTSAMAQAVAIKFQDLQDGLNPNAMCGTPSVNCLSNDPYVQLVGSSYVLKLNGAIVPTSTSTIPVSNTNTAEAPIVPEMEVSTVNQGIPYTVYTYPTVAASAPGLVTVVVIVTWRSPTGGIDRVVGEDGIGQP
ncbi:MAG: type IV pilus modification PilV family protein [Acidimicrobiales bacterium]